MIKLVTTMIQFHTILTSTKDVFGNGFYSLIFRKFYENFPLFIVVRKMSSSGKMICHDGFVRSERMSINQQTHITNMQIDHRLRWGIKGTQITCGWSGDAPSEVIAVESIFR